jgi:predicted Fe-Mo cluster-binding NifX family protein
MRVAVASDDGRSIAGHFGRCAGFEIFDIDGSGLTKIEHRPNSNSHHHDHEPGDCQHHNHEAAGRGHESFLNALHDCQAVICRGMGRRAIADLAAKGIKAAITAQDVSVDEAVELFARGVLVFSIDSQCCSH